MSPNERAARDFVAAWERGDHAAMHDLLSDDAKARYPLPRFRRAYRRAANTATLTALDPRDPEEVTSDSVTVPVVLATRVFGDLRGDLRLPVSEGQVEWSPSLVFPELGRG